VLNIQLVERLLTPGAPRSEQTQVTMLLAAHEARTEIEEAQLAKVRLLKAGLMEDLLTGRVRVTKLLQDAS
jgi:type I restriction enzyme S subunit